MRRDEQTLSEKLDGVVRKLTAVRLAFDMKGTNNVTMLRAINTISTLKNQIAALSIEQTEPVAWIVREITPSNGRGPNTIITGSVVPRGYEAITPLYAHPPTTRIADSAEAGGSATLSKGAGGDHG
ncbi:hypothetical protein [Shinella sp. DD12]|uniref:hypothetical protein n=1 Tax=Shinella sp. DD12 TaxID=1410620 RepID=UPI000437ABB8|nr:hypothetical protein [Shinella sp. DD12]EYR81791.1 hypothetical protein SHLA_4c000820 [Shinella sp. DD12]